MFLVEFILYLSYFYTIFHFNASLSLNKLLFDKFTCVQELSFYFITCKCAIYNFYFRLKCFLFDKLPNTNAWFSNSLTVFGTTPYLFFLLKTYSSCPINMSSGHYPYTKAKSIAKQLKKKKKWCLRVWECWKGTFIGFLIKSISWSLMHPMELKKKMKQYL